MFADGLVEVVTARGTVLRFQRFDRPIFPKTNRPLREGKDFNKEYGRKTSTKNTQGKYRPQKRQKSNARQNTDW